MDYFYNKSRNMEQIMRTTREARRKIFNVKISKHFLQIQNRELKNRLLYLYLATSDHILGYSREVQRFKTFCIQVKLFKQFGEYLT